MRNKILQPVFLFVCVITFSALVTVNAQSLEVEPEIRQYIEEKANKARVPSDISNSVRGDLNNDGAEDVVIQYYLQIGYPGNLTNTYLAVFLNKNDKMMFTAEIDATVVPAKIENGVLVCDKYGEGGKKFDKVGTIRYKFAKGKLVEIKAKK